MHHQVPHQCGIDTLSGDYLAHDLPFGKVQRKRHANPLTAVARQLQPVRATPPSRAHFAVMFPGVQRLVVLSKQLQTLIAHDTVDTLVIDPVFIDDQSCSNAPEAIGGLPLTISVMDSLTWAS